MNSKILKDIIKEEIANLLTEKEQIKKGIRRGPSTYKNLVPNNIIEFANREGFSSEVKKVAAWNVKLTGKGINGGVAIGKHYSTLVLDLFKYQDAACYITDGKIKILGMEVKSYQDFKNAFYSKYELVDQQGNVIKEEGNTTATGGGEYMTPNAFKKNDKIKNGAEKSAKSSGYDEAKPKIKHTVNLYEGLVTIFANAKQEAEIKDKDKLFPELNDFIKRAQSLQYNIGGSTKYEIPALYFPNFVWAGGKQKFGPSFGLLVGSNTILVCPIKTKKMFRIGESLLSSLVKNNTIPAYKITFKGNIKESINEINYKAYKAFEGMSSKKKINTAISEINTALYEMNRYLSQNKKLMEEENLTEDQYWKSTCAKFAKIHERLNEFKKHLNGMGLKEMLEKIEEDNKGGRKYTPKQFETLTLDLLKKTSKKNYEYVKSMYNTSTSNGDFEEIIRSEWENNKEPKDAARSILYVLGKEHKLKEQETKLDYPKLNIKFGNRNILIQGRKALDKAGIKTKEIDRRTLQTINAWDEDEIKDAFNQPDFKVGHFEITKI